MRDHKRLRAFQRADALAVRVYKATAAFPKSETFGLVAQMRRAAVSVACNIVEGCARPAEADYVRFLDIAYGSLKELEYQVELCERLGFMPESLAKEVSLECAITAKLFCRLILALRRSTH